MAYIYKITNKHNGKSYIGKTEKANPLERFQEHIRESRKERHENRPLYRAINKYGAESFIFSVLEETDYPEEREIYYIDKLNTFGSTGYNATMGGDGKKYISEDEVISKYHELQTMRSTAETLNISIDTISTILHKNNIELYDAHASLKKAVLQIDKDSDEVVNAFDSIADAQRAMGLTKSHIGNVCNGKRRTTLGFKWSFK